MYEGRRGRFSRPLHAEGLERVVVQAAARRQELRDLELRERRLRVAGKIAVDRSGIETQLGEPFLDELDGILGGQGAEGQGKAG